MACGLGATPRRAESDRSLIHANIAVARQSTVISDRCHVCKVPRHLQGAIRSTPPKKGKVRAHRSQPRPEFKAATRPKAPREET